MDAIFYIVFTGRNNIGYCAVIQYLDDSEHVAQGHVLLLGELKAHLGVLLLPQGRAVEGFLKERNGLLDGHGRHIKQRRTQNNSDGVFVAGKVTQAKRSGHRVEGQTSNNPHCCLYRTLLVCTHQETLL